ncbi:LOW QUALITY PROTEIN: OTU domain-containing protein 5-A-like [Acropora millepora]|uniref:LOW QUALITY PROTEIN: OTU domain-containing protein 5-A-like n=1 Tax=Acropora millepora TaxID=45264 RepID=UPI001CF2F942|nr:LOW QUALITY PROTEIN: OTU domain-containing protein 5-A-like [Acropora millepora]
MTILPKKKHSESKKSDTTSNNDNRPRIRGNNSSWSSPASVAERNRPSEEYSGHEDQYLGNSFESREAADVASSSSKRRHRSPPHRHKYHERHGEETGYNSSDEHDAPIKEQPLSNEEMERQFEQALKEKKGYIIKKMSQDGACLFRAVAEHVYGDQEMHSEVRRHCMDYMLKNADYFSQYVTEDFNGYIMRKRESHCHGNHVEIQAMCEIYNRTIEVYQYSTEPINIFHSSYKTDYEPIRVSYHNGVHYNAVLNPNKPSVGVGLGLSGYKPWGTLVSDAFKQSEDWHIEQQMLADKLRCTDWEATNEAMEEAVARESYLEWLREREKRARGTRTLPRSSPTATSSTSTCTESKRPTSPHQRDRDRDAPDNAPPSKSPRHSPSSPRHESFASASCSEAVSCVAAVSQAMTTSTVSTTKVTYYDSKPGCSTESSSPPSPPGATGGATATQPNYLDYLPPGGYGFSEWEDESILATVLAESQKEYFEKLRKDTVKEKFSDEEFKS